MTLTPTTRAVLEMIEALGYRVRVLDDSVMAIECATGETYIVRGETYDAAVELAEQVGIDLEDE